MDVSLHIWFGSSRLRPSHGTPRHRRHNGRLGQFGSTNPVVGVTTRSVLTSGLSIATAPRRLVAAYADVLNKTSLRPHLDTKSFSRDCLLLAPLNAFCLLQTKGSRGTQIHALRPTLLVDRVYCCLKRECMHSRHFGHVADESQVTTLCKRDGSLCENPEAMMQQR